MFPNPQSQLSPNTDAYEITPLVKPTGFREYDARWLFGSEINLMGVQALGMGIGTLVHETGRAPGHRHRTRLPRLLVLDQDTRSISGMMAAGLRVKDIGLALSPMAYFGQFDARLPLRRDGDRLAQRQRLDRRQDGRQPAA